MSNPESGQNLTEMSDEQLWQRANSLHTSGQIRGVREVQVELERRFLQDALQPNGNRDRRIKIAECVQSIDDWYLIDNSAHGTSAWRMSHPRMVPWTDPAEVEQLNSVITVLSDSVVKSFRGSHVTIKTTNRNVYPQNEPDQSYYKQHCEMFVSPDHMDRDGAAKHPDGLRLGEYRAGHVCDLLINQNNQTYFASVFFSLDERRARYRLYRFSTPVTQALMSIENLKQLLDAGAAKLDEGALEYGENFGATGRAVFEWLRHQLNLDSKHG